ncbi:ABC transporter ATP-binding protein [Bradyrhizobium liaoningense]|uniref:ABC transporter ATP-binding protein n=1 Tax=Bradyrhizobium liaoningense TaxID=43992 RepID=UPI001FD37CF5|nr:ATP-binding cassette domain-containing protein [Bradyrhizobium liaoningense]
MMAIVGEIGSTRQAEVLPPFAGLPSGPFIVSAAKIVKRFGALTVVDHVDLSLRAGQAVGIVGPNGAGKTTLLGVLAGALAASAGKLTFLDVDVTDMPAADRCRLGIIRTHQVPRPFAGMTVFENVLVATTNGGRLTGSAAYQCCVDSLDLCGMLRVANRRAETLGLLDRKRLELARALATNPSVLLLDEIGGGLTDAEAAELVAAIRLLVKKGITIVWIEHMVHILLQVAERLICMDAGQVIADGAPREVLSNPAVVKAYLGGSAT